MATRPLVDNSSTPNPIADRLLLAEELLELAERAETHARATGSTIALKRGDALVIRTSSGIAPEVGSSLPLGEGAIGLCGRLGKPFNVAEESKVDATLRMLGVKSVLAVPIHHAGIFYGVLAVSSQTPEAFTRMHMAIIMTMGNEVARVLKRLETAAEIAPGTPLRPASAPAPVAPPPNPVSLSRSTQVSTTAPQNVVDTLKTIEQKPVAPMKLIIDPPMALRATPVETKPVAPAPPAPIAPMPLVNLDAVPQAPAPLPDLLCPGDDPRRYGTMKNAKSLEPKPTFAFTNTYERPSGSRLKAPAIAVVLLVIAAAAFGMWRRGKTAAPARETIAATEPATVTAPAAAVTAPPAVPATITPAPTTTAVVTPAKTSLPKTEPEKPVIAAKQEGEKPKGEEAALRIAAPAAKPVEAPVEAPALTLASTNAMPELLAAKAPAASLATKKSTATPPAALRTVAPIFPEVARRSGTYGDVKLQVMLSATGKVTDVRVLSGPALLRQAAVSAVNQWQYRPGMLDGRPTDSTMDVVVKFSPPR